VFVLGIIEQVLTMFSKKTCNLVYESLLHVAITRQKKSIYIGIEKNNDDICNRFIKLGIEEDEDIKPQLNYIRIHNNYSKVQNYVNNNDDIFTEMNDKIIEPNNYKKLLPDNENNKPIIDWGHHVIRYCVMIYYLMKNIIENEVIENEEHKDQFITILKNLSKKNISYYKYSHYNKILREIDENNKKGLKNSIIPLLLFDTNENTKYYKYTNILKDIIINIQNKITEFIKINKLPPLCPLECVVLLFMIKIIDNGSYSEISIMDIYSIMYCYDYCSNKIDKEHTEKNKCICHTCFDEGKSTNISSHDEFHKSIKNHYNNVEHINQTYYEYNKHITEILKIENMKYNIYHKTYFGKKNDNFSIINEYTIIGHSTNHIIYFIIKPQYNKLNFNNIMCESILNNFMILNCSPDYENNNKRYNNKKIYTCILTLDSIKPIFYELNIDKNDILMNQILKKYLITTYTEHHEQIHKLFKYCQKNKPKNISSINYTLEELKKYNLPVNKLPQYILDYFYDISKELEMCGNDKNKIESIMIKVNDKDLFINRLDVYLEKNIDSFLETKEDEIIDY
jgi:hypothetical protein